MNDAPATPGLAASLRRLAGTLLELAQVRLELLSSDIEHEKLRLLGTLLWVAIATLLAGIGLAVLAMLVAVLFWDSHRVLALSLLSVVYLLCAGLAGWQARRRWQTPRGVFATSADELARDRAALDEQRPRDA